MKYVPDGRSWFTRDIEEVQALWGNGNDILWSKGEALLISGPTGAGKTTIAGQLIAGVLGVDGYDELFGFKIRQHVGHGEKLLYLSMDRPQQAKRALRRQLGSTEAQLQIDNRLSIGYGPLDYTDINDAVIGQWQAFGVRVVVIDSLKDLVINPTDEKAAAEFMRVVQALLVHGIEVVMLHHNVKRQRKMDGSKMPVDLASIAGSHKITDGVGTVVAIDLTEEDSNEIIMVRHLKPSVNIVKPFKARHNHTTGRTTRIGSTRDDELLAVIGSSANTTEIAHGLGLTTEAQKKALKRDLSKMAEQGILTEAKQGGTRPSVWLPGEQIAFDTEGDKPRQHSPLGPAFDGV